MNPPCVNDHRAAIENSGIVPDERVVAWPKDDSLVFAIPKCCDADDSAEMRLGIRLRNNNPQMRRQPAARSGHQERVAALEGLEHRLRGRQGIQLGFDCSDLSLGLSPGPENVLVRDGDRAPLGVLPLGEVM